MYLFCCVYKAIFIFADFWKQAGIDVNLNMNSTVYINNTSKNKYLGQFEANKPELGNNLKYRSENWWKIGSSDNNGYFNLIHLKTQKLLTATSSPSNTFKVDESKEILQ